MLQSLCVAAGVLSRSTRLIDWTIHTLLRDLRPQMNTDKHGFKHGETTQKIIGCFFEVYNELEPRFKRLIFDNPRKSIRENPCLSEAALLSSDEEFNLNALKA